MKVRGITFLSRQPRYPILIDRPNAIYIETSGEKWFRVEETKNGELMVSAEEGVLVRPMQYNCIAITTKPFDAFRKALLEASDV